MAKRLGSRHEQKKINKIRAKVSNKHESSIMDSFLVVTLIPPYLVTASERK